MDLIKLPTADGDYRDDWKDIAQIAKYINALADLRVSLSQTRNKLTWTESSATLELLGASGSTSSSFRWQPYLSPFTGTGTPPSDQGRRIRIVPAAINSATLPSNLNVEIVVPANQTDPYFIWLESSQDTTGNVTGVVYGYGATLPSEPTIIDDGTGNVPGTSYMLLFAVTSTATDVNLPPVIQNQNTALNLKPVPLLVALSTTGVQVIQRKMEWTAPGQETSYPSFTAPPGS